MLSLLEITIISTTTAPLATVIIIIVIRHPASTNIKVYEEVKSLLRYWKNRPNIFIPAIFGRVADEFFNIHISSSNFSWVVVVSDTRLVAVCVSSVSGLTGLGVVKIFPRACETWYVTKPTVNVIAVTDITGITK